MCAGDRMALLNMYIKAYYARRTLALIQKKEAYNVELGDFLTRGEGAAWCQSPFHAYCGASMARGGLYLPDSGRLLVLPQFLKLAWRGASAQRAECGPKEGTT